MKDTVKSNQRDLNLSRDVKNGRGKTEPANFTSRMTD